MSNGFELAKTLMQLSSLSEQRKARKEELEFKKMYEAPLKEAYTGYYNAMIDKMQNEELLGYEKALKRAQVFGAEAEVGITQATFDEIKRLRGGSEEDKDIARNYLLKIDQNQAFRDQLAAIRVQNEQLQTMISSQNQQLGIMKFNQALTESLLGAVADPELRTLFTEVLGKKGADTVRKGAVEKFTGAKAPEKKEGGFWDIFKRKDRFPDEGIFAPKPKPAPAKAPEKKEEKPGAVMLTTDETAAIYEKARENDISPLDIAAGVQKLIEMFPELDREDLLSAHERLAEGFTVEELIDHYNEKKEK